MKTEKEIRDRLIALKKSLTDIAISGVMVEIEVLQWVLGTNVGDTCPHCNEGKLKTVEPNEPYHDGCLICPTCDSTFPLPED